MTALADPPQTETEATTGSALGPQWNFYCADEDRSTGWTNHCFVLQYVCYGYGKTPAKAWAEAKRADRIPGNFILPEGLTAIRDEDELPYYAT